MGAETPLLSPSSGPNTSFATITERMLWVTAGPELSFRAGPTRIYGFVSGGLGTFHAHPAVRSTASAGAYRPESFDAPPGGTSFAWSAGGGLGVPLLGGFALDLGGAFVALGRSAMVIDPPLVLDAQRRENFQTAQEIPSVMVVRVGLTYSQPPARPAATGPPAPRPKRPRPVPAAADSTRGGH